MANKPTTITPDSTSLMGTSNDLPPSYDAAVTSAVNSSGPYVPAGTADAKDVKVPLPSDEPQYSSPAGPPPSTIPSMPPTTVYNYVNPVTHEVITSLLPPDHPQMVCLQQGHEPRGRFGIVGVLAAIFWFPLGVAVCLMDHKVQCRRCGQVIDPGLCG